MSIAPFSFDRSASIQVCADGPEVMAYSGDGVPMWQAFLEGIAVGVCSVNQRISTIDTDGRLVCFQAHDGTKLVDTRLDVQSQGLSSAKDGRLVTWDSNEIVLASRDGEGFRIAQAGATSVAFGGPGDNHLGVVCGNGRFHLYDIATLQLLYTVDAVQPLKDVAYSAIGFWAALSGSQLFILEETPASKDTPAVFAISRTLALGGEASSFTIATDGVIAAFLMGESAVWVRDLAGDKPLGTVELHRPIGEIAFGVGNMLGIGLEDGEANRVNLSVGGSWRTNPGFGRGAQNWPINVNVDNMGVRQAVIGVAAGGQPIAQLVDHSSAGSKNGCLYTVIGVFAVGLLCGGCTGVLGVIYAMWG